MICQAKGCGNEAMPTGLDNPKGLCGACHERDEEQPVRLKGKPGRPRIPDAEERQRERDREYQRKKRQGQPHTPMKEVRERLREVAREARLERKPMIRQCAAIAWHTKRTCTKAALPGSIYCHWHHHLEKQP